MRIYTPPLNDHSIPWRALYGLLLIQLCRAADAESARLGHFVEAIIPTEREFLAARRATRRYRLSRRKGDPLV